MIGSKLASLYQLTKQNTVLASLHKLAKQNTVEMGHSFRRIPKKVSISISFQTWVENFLQ